MTPEKIRKIRALADDPRGDPATRAIAQAALKRYAQTDKSEKPSFHDVPPYRNEQHPGMRTSPEYDRHRFMDLGAWKTTSNGNPTFVVVRNGRSFRIVLFRHKKTPTHGWMRINTITDETEFSGKFRTIGEAHANAWSSLMAM
jgi:hypothetical protein